MDPTQFVPLEQIKPLINQGVTLEWWSYFLVFLLCTIGGWIGSFLSTYLKEKGKYLAMKEELGNILKQTEQITQTQEEVKNEIARRSAFKDRLYIDRYNHIVDLNNRLEQIRVNLSRERKNLKVPSGFREGKEIVPLTEIFRDLRSNRFILTNIFFELLNNKALFAAEKLRKAKTDEEWENKIKEWERLSEKLSYKIEEVFNINESKY